ncbi:uncharacterized protein BKA55DRAFT_595572 [Fusarium redolens]|uniref:Uncharacterized protein n=1 Tax=Fusarium redolens TaxID=48865 RepID=A0A9P9GTI3_FUSRE|nr:uncharacterized protein BKA55DRAFT_595572 [Fusarium redolens]KAH7244457.1 hypothetical protein BKA55DRAFT_595572 [Fusarium redolens]
MENNPRETYGRSSINRINSSLQNPCKENNRQTFSEPFSPTGLLGERYDLLKQQMEASSRIAEQHDSPFTRGLLGSLAEPNTRGYRASYDGTRVGGDLTRVASTASSSNRFGPRRTPSVSSVRTDSIYCAQSGVTPPPLLDITSSLPQRRPSRRDRNCQGVRSPTVQPLLSLPEISTNQWNNSHPPALGRSHSVAVRSSSGSWGPSRSRSGSHPTSELSTLGRRVSTATAPARPETWYQGDRTEPKRRGMLRSC